MKEKTVRILKKCMIALAAVAITVVCLIPFFGSTGASGKIQLVVDLHGYTPSVSRIPPGRRSGCFQFDVLYCTSVYERESRC